MIIKKDLKKTEDKIKQSYLAKSADKIEGAIKKCSFVSLAFQAILSPPSFERAESFPKETVWNAKVIDANIAQNKRTIDLISRFLLCLK